MQSAQRGLGSNRSINLLTSVRKDFIIILSYRPCPMVEHVLEEYFSRRTGAFG
jgi:hypothetical protein